jgi:hypothetical protein
MGSTPSKTIRAICWANTKCTVQITTYSHQNLLNFIREITVQNKQPLCQIWVDCWRERFPIPDVDFDAVWRACLGHQETVVSFQWTTGELWKAVIQKPPVMGSHTPISFVKRLQLLVDHEDLERH